MKLIAKLQLMVDDPMWPDHAEISKETLKDIIANLEGGRAIAEAWLEEECVEGHYLKLAAMLMTIGDNDKPNQPRG